MAFDTYLRDLEFILFEQLELDPLSESEKYADFNKDLARMIVSEANKFAKGVMAPLNKKGDETGAVFKDSEVRMPEGFRNAWNKYSEGGWLGLSGNPKYGGQGLPVTLKMAVDDLTFAANTSFALTGSLSTSAADVVSDFASEEAKALFLEKIYTGQWAATMCLTEPGAGSALGNTRTQAVKIEGTADRYKITGGKIFISMGEHDLTENIIHLVLAKAPDSPEGTRGISLFIVPKFKVNADGSLGTHNDVVCTRIEHKMGIKANATCQLSFGDAGNCEGILIGEENKGLMYMFRMMNEERIAVGVQGMALASSAYLYSADYCRERLQGPAWNKRRDKTAQNVPIIEHPDVRRMLMWQKSHVEGMRALLLSTAFFMDLSQSTADEDKRRLYGGFVELLTPICKAFCTDRGFDSTILAVQCLGGYGYTSEYDVEQYARDSKIGSIYEGTNHIQAQDFLGRKVPMAKGQVFAGYMKFIEDDLAALAGDPEFEPYVARVREAKAEVEKAIGFLAERARDPEKGYQTLIHAMDAVYMMGDLCLSHLLLKQAGKAALALAKAFEKAGATDEDAKLRLVEDDDELKYYYGKTRSARFYVTQVLPAVFARSKAIFAEDASAMDPGL